MQNNRNQVESIDRNRKIEGETFKPFNAFYDITIYYNFLNFFLKTKWQTIHAITGSVLRWFLILEYIYEYECIYEN